MAKALFLDVDGVLNSSGSCLARTGTVWKMQADNTVLLAALEGIIGDMPYLVTHTIATIDPTAVALVNRLFTKEPELVLVLSTSHRALFHHTTGYGTELHLRALGIYFQLLGIHAQIYGVTPVHGGTRGQEVAAYLDAHPEIDEHLAVDDGDDFHPNDCTFLRIDPSYGFCGRDYFLATRELRITESNIIV
jgi:hypothetical protein